MNEPAIMLRPFSELHRPGVDNRTACDKIVPLTAVKTTRLAGEVYGLPTCYRCFPPRQAPGGTR